MSHPARSWKGRKGLFFRARCAVPEHPLEDFPPVTFRSWLLSFEYLYARTVGWSVDPSFDKMHRNANYFSLIDLSFFPDMSFVFSSVIARYSSRNVLENRTYREIIFVVLENINRNEIASYLELFIIIYKTRALLSFDRAYKLAQIRC